MAVVAIPTRYKGVTFRSRLEARWAVFFDAVGIRAHYEHEGYQLPCGWYLPDFWLPDIGAWVEIKPITPTEDELGKCSELAITNRGRCFLLSGNIGWWIHGSPGSGFVMDQDGGGDIGCEPVSCSSCFRVDIATRGQKCKCGHAILSNSERIRDAVDYANRYQFRYEAP